MNEEIMVPENEVFYYVRCPLCGFDFVVWSQLKREETFRGFMAVTNDDVVTIHCPSCGEQFPLVIETAPEVFLLPNEDRITEGHTSFVAEIERMKEEKEG